MNEIMKVLESLEDGKPFACRGAGRVVPLIVRESSPLYLTLDGISVRVVPCSESMIQQILNRYPDRMGILYSQLAEATRIPCKILLFYRGSPTLPNLEGWGVVGEIGGVVLFLYCSLAYYGADMELFWGVLIDTLFSGLDLSGVRRYRLTHPYTGRVGIPGWVRRDYWGVVQSGVNESAELEYPYKLPAESSRIRIGRCHKCGCTLYDSPYADNRNGVTNWVSVSLRHGITVSICNDCWQEGGGVNCITCGSAMIADCSHDGECPRCLRAKYAYFWCTYCGGWAGDDHGTSLACCEKCFDMHYIACTCGSLHRRDDSLPVLIVQRWGAWGCTRCKSLTDLYYHAIEEKKSQRGVE